MGNADTGPANTGPANTGPANTGNTDIGDAETGNAETGKARTGNASSRTSSGASTIERVLVLGAKGQLGSALVNQNWPLGVTVLPATRDQLDVTDGPAVRSYLERWRPDLVINTASYASVDDAEREPEQASRVNVIGVRSIVDALDSIGGRLLQLSTAYVFDGTGPGWYIEHDQVNPLGVYGRSMRGGELAALELEDSLVIRTSWLYSSYGPNFVRTIDRLSRRQSLLEAVDDRLGCPTSADALAKAIVGAVGSGLGYTGVFHLTAPDDATWWDLADEVLRLNGRRDEVRLERSRSDEHRGRALRPANARLSSEAFATAYGLALPPWRESLREVVQRLDTQTLALTGPGLAGARPR